MRKVICLFAISKLSATQLDKDKADIPSTQNEESTGEKKHISERIKQKKEKISFFIKKINELLEKVKSNACLLSELKEIRLELENILDLDICEKEINTKVQRLSKRILLIKPDQDKKD